MQCASCLYGSAADPFPAGTCSVLGHICTAYQEFISQGYQKPGREKESVENGSTKTYYALVTFLHHFFSSVAFLLDVAEVRCSVFLRFY